MRLTAKQVDELHYAQQGAHASWYPGPVKVETGRGDYEESRYVSFHSMVLKDHDDDHYRVYYEYTKEDQPGLVADSIEIRLVTPHVTTTIEYREVR